MIELFENCKQDASLKPRDCKYFYIPRMALRKRVPALNEYRMMVMKYIAYVFFWSSVLLLLSFAVLY